MKLKTFLFVLLSAVVLLSAAGSSALTDQERADLIAQIQQQLAVLQAQLMQLLSQQADSGAWCHNFNQNLLQGATGSEVHNLHLALAAQGFNVSSTDLQNQSFGTSTKAAVILFQEKYRSDILTPYGLTRGTGNVYQATRAKLNQLYGCNSTTCSPSWQTGAWSACSNSVQTRTVTDTNNCGVNTSKPSTSQGCTTSCSPNWQTGAWSACANSTQTRTVTDSNNCGITTNRPDTTQSCIDGSNSCIATCVTQPDGVYAISCSGYTTKCELGGCEKTYSTSYTYTGGTVQTIQTLTGTQCTSGGIAGCNPNWQTGDWSACSGGTQTRTVTDANNCNTTINKPATSQSCSTIKPTVNIKANNAEDSVKISYDTEGNYGTSFSINWTSSKADTCSVYCNNDNWQGTGLSGSKTFYQVKLLTDTAGNVLPSRSIMCSVGCTNSAGSTSDNVTITIARQPTVKDFKVNNDDGTLNGSGTVISGQPFYLSWNATNVDSCTLSGDWTGIKNMPALNYNMSNIDWTTREKVGFTSRLIYYSGTFATKTYTVTCTGPGGTASATNGVTISPGLSVGFMVNGFYANGNFANIEAGKSVPFSWWATQEVTSCTASGSLYWSGPKAAYGTTYVSLACPSTIGMLNHEIPSATYTLTCNTVDGKTISGTLTVQGYTSACSYPQFNPPFTP